MNIAIVGTGYVGLVSGACFAEMGVNVTCVDIDTEKIARLKAGEIPIYEPGLSDLVGRNSAAGRLHFATSLTEVLGQVEIVFCAVGTPSDEDGSPVGTSAKVRQTVNAELERRGRTDIPFELASNPEFLKEGAAIKDFMSPDRVVIGIESDYGRKLMERLYRPFLLNNFRVMFMDLPSAEMTKYAANAIGADARIGGKFLYPGCGYGGSCFPKDVRALIRTGEENGCPMQIVRAVDEVNERQKSIVFDKLKRIFDSNVAGKHVAIWGLAFKPETDDMRCAPSLEVIRLLVENGATVSVFDPVATDECRRRLGDCGGALTYANDMYDSLVDADALALLTEWKQFRLPSWAVVAKTLRGLHIVDGRNIYRDADLEPFGLVLHGIGRG